MVLQSRRSLFREVGRIGGHEGAGEVKRMEGGDGLMLIPDSSLGGMCVPGSRGPMAGSVNGREFGMLGVN